MRSNQRGYGRRPERPGVRFHRRVLARNASIRDALAEIRVALGPLGMSVEELGTVELVLAEVMNNVAEHAYAWRRDGELMVQLDHSSEGLFCQVTDDGRPMPQGILPFGNPADPETPVEMMPEGGFGWLLIRNLARDVCYVRHSGYNQLSFRLPVGLDVREQSAGLAAKTGAALSG